MTKKQPETVEEIQAMITKLEGSKSQKSLMEKKRLERKLATMTKGKEASGVFSAEEDKKKLQLIYVDIDKIDFPEFKDRSEINMVKVASIAKSIERYGLLQPITLEDLGNGRYRKINGRLRIEAHKLLGLSKIRAFIYVPAENFTLRDFNMVVLHENTEREGLNNYDLLRNVLNIICIDLGDVGESEAVRYANMALNYQKGNIKNVTDEVIRAYEVISAAIIDTNVYRSIQALVTATQMLSMPTELLVALQENNITYSAALELNKIKDDEKRNALLKRCIDEGMSVSELSKEVKVINGKKPKDTDEVKTVFKQMEKRFKKLDQKKKKEFTKELNELMERY